MPKGKATINNPTFLIFKRLAKYVLYKIGSNLTVERLFQAIAKDDIKESKKNKDDKIPIIYFSFSVTVLPKKSWTAKHIFYKNISLLTK